MLARALRAGNSTNDGENAMYVNGHLRWIALGAVLTGMMFLAGCSESASKPERAKRPPPKVGVVTIQAQPVELFTVLPGRTTPYRVAEIRPQVSGIITERLFNEGAKVEAGEKLYQIDPKPYRAELARAEAELTAAKAAVGSVAERAERYAELVEINAVSQQKYADVKAELARKRAQVQVAEAQVQSARINLGYTSIESPISGRISRSFITVGALVTANQSQPLTRVTRLDPIYVDIPRSVEQVMQLKRAFKQGQLKKTESGGASVTLLLGGGREYAHKGTLQFTDVTVEADTASVTLRARFANPEHQLMPGMFVRVRLSEGIKEHALLVPQQGVIHNRSGNAVALVVGENNKLEKHVLELGRAIGSHWLVEDGLAVGDRVLVSGRQLARAGMKVRPEPADIPNELDGNGDITGRTGVVAPASGETETETETESESESDSAKQAGAGRG